MRERPLLRIGEFAQIGQVSIATLRHYDQYGLLTPKALDPETGYRYYSLDQLPRLHRILALKELGFPLDQIAQLLEEHLSWEHLQEMFRLKQAQIQQVIALEQARLARVAARLRQIEQEGTMPTYEILLKQVDPLLVATIRAPISIEADLEPRYRSLAAYLEQHGIRQTTPDLLLRHSRYEWSEEGMYADVEFAIPLGASLPGNEQVQVRTLPGGLMACTVHTGYPLALGRAYVALHHWMEENEYHFAGPPRQIHLQRAEHLDSRHSVTELQFPLTRHAR